MATFKRLQDRLLLNEGQQYCRMLQGEHSAILLTFIKLQFVIMIFVLSIFEWPFYTGFSVNHSLIVISLGDNIFISLDGSSVSTQPKVL